MISDDRWLDGGVDGQAEATGESSGRAMAAAVARAVHREIGKPEGVHWTGGGGRWSGLRRISPETRGGAPAGTVLPGRARTKGRKPAAGLLGSRWCGSRRRWPAAAVRQGGGRPMGIQCAAAVGAGLEDLGGLLPRQGGCWWRSSGGLGRSAAAPAREEAAWAVGGGNGD